jgi:hypothetical protein
LAHHSSTEGCPRSGVLCERLSPSLTPAPSRRYVGAQRRRWRKWGTRTKSRPQRSYLSHAHSASWSSISTGETLIYDLERYELNLDLRRTSRTPPPAWGAIPITVSEGRTHACRLPIHARSTTGMSTGTRSSLCFFFLPFRFKCSSCSARGSDAADAQSDGSLREVPASVGDRGAKVWRVATRVGT